MKLIIGFFKMSLSIIYFFLKLLPINNKKVVLISRQSDKVPLDFILLKQEILAIDSDYHVVYLCQMLKSGLLNYIKYAFHILKQMYFLATSKICIVDSYCVSVCLLKHKKNLKIIQIWHAIGTVKKFGYQTVGKEYGHKEKIIKLLNMHQNYDYVISGSKTMQPIFAQTFHIDEDKVINIGTPRIDYLLNNCNGIKKDIIKDYSDIKKKKVILYVPTYRKDKKIELDKLINTIDFDKYHLIVKNHPVKYENISNKNIYTCKKYSSMQLLTIADYVITDYSAISIEAALLKKPVYFYIYDYKEYICKNGLNIDIKKEMPEYCFKDFRKLYKKMKKEDYDYQNLEKFKNKYVDNQNKNCGYLLANYIVNGNWSGK